MSDDVKGGWTPGPWHVESDGYVKPVNWTSTSCAICELILSNHTVANARLIAAAPELFEALVDAVEALENVNRHVGLLGGERGRLERARAAIVKATGGTPL